MAIQTAFIMTSLHDWTTFRDLGHDKLPHESLACSALTSAWTLPPHDLKIVFTIRTCVHLSGLAGWVGTRMRGWVRYLWRHKRDHVVKTLSLLKMTSPSPQHWSWKSLHLLISFHVIWAREMSQQPVLAILSFTELSHFNLLINLWFPKPV